MIPVAMMRNNKNRLFSIGDHQFCSQSCWITRSFGSKKWSVSYGAQKHVIDSYMRYITLCICICSNMTSMCIYIYMYTYTYHFRSYILLFIIVYHISYIRYHTVLCIYIYIYIISHSHITEHNPTYNYQNNC